MFLLRVEEAPASSVAIPSHPHVEVDPFNGLECDASGTPRTRFLCPLGPTVRIRVHWDSELDRTLLCGAPDGQPCLRCRPGRKPRISTYTPAILSKSLDTIMVGRGHKVLWHVPGRHPLVMPSNPRGHTFRVWRDPVPEKGVTGRLQVYDLAAPVRNLTEPTFDPLPHIARFFASVIPDIVLPQSQPLNPVCAPEPATTLNGPATKAKLQSLISSIANETGIPQRRPASKGGAQ